jgi:hypothetical protein
MRAVLQVDATSEAVVYDTVVDPATCACAFSRDVSVANFVSIGHRHEGPPVRRRFHVERVSLRSVIAAILTAEITAAIVRSEAQLRPNLRPSGWLPLLKS